MRCPVAFRKTLCITSSFFFNNFNYIKWYRLLLMPSFYFFRKIEWYYYFLFCFQKRGGEDASLFFSIIITFFSWKCLFFLCNNGCYNSKNPWNIRIGILFNFTKFFFLLLVNNNNWWYSFFVKSISHENFSNSRFWKGHS